MLEKLESFMDVNGLNCLNQFGFTKGYSTQHALTLLGSTIARSIEDKQPVIGASLDLEKCYDSVCPLLLTKKMEDVGFPHHWTRVFFNFLRQRSFAVKIGNVISKIRTARTGLPQGSVAAPGLFKFFSHDLPQPDRNRGLSSISFADDHIVLAEGPPLEAAETLSSFLDDIHNFYESNGNRINKEKSNTIVFTGVLNRLTRPARNEIKEVVVRMDGELLPRVDSIKYLGVTLNTKLSHVQHIQLAISKAAGITGMMKGVLAKRGLLSERVKTTFYKTAIRPILTYGFGIWSTASSHQLESMRMFERRIIRWTRSDSGRNQHTRRFINSSILYRDSKIERLDRWTTKAYLKSMAKMEESFNQLITSLFTQDAIDRVLRPGSRYKPPEYLYHFNTESPLFDEEDRLTFFNQRLSEEYP